MFCYHTKTSNYRECLQQFYAVTMNPKTSSPQVLHWSYLILWFFSTLSPSSPGFWQLLSISVFHNLAIAEGHWPVTLWMVLLSCISLIRVSCMSLAWSNKRNMTVGVPHGGWLDPGSWPGLSMIIFSFVIDMTWGWGFERMGIRCS